MSELTQERLKELLNYDPDTGIFTNKVTRGTTAREGDIAGSSDKDGYVVITINYKSYKAHRLVFLYVDGYLPENDVDHKDQIPWHNWQDNLRESSKQCNGRNCKLNKKNTSSITGVSWDIDNKKWLAQITIMYKHKKLGRYNQFHNAVCARLAAEQCLNWAECDLNSPAYKYVQTHIIKKEK